MKKKTVGILTFNRAVNYGAVLQAYALKNVCEDLGYEVHIVNYMKEVKDDSPSLIREFLNSPNKKKAGIKVCRDVLSFVGDKKRWRRFYTFRKEYLNESKACMRRKDIEDLGYDIYIAGSDQIWNYNITGYEFDPVYFGDFTSEAKSIVYAASSQDVPFPLDKEIEFKKMLENTNAEFSIREQKLADYVTELTGVAHPVVLDPTLLAGRSVFEKLIDDKYPKKPYILIYQIDANPASDISVRSLESKFKCKVYTMTVPRIGSIHGRKGESGPGKFLALLKNSSFLVTNSFHGIAFSLLFEKDFFVYENGGVMSRIDGLLESVDLRDRKVKMVADIDPDDRIDYKSVNEKLNLLQKKSLDYLKNSLDGKKCSKPTQKVKDFHLLKMQSRGKCDCSGCTACESICPVHAIHMCPDEEGFLYPSINSQVCIGCGKCDQACGFVPTKQKNFKLPKAFGIKHKNEEVRVNSRSGAAFVAFSDLILNDGGVVYGAAMLDDFTVCHIRATSFAERNRMKSAKYVQSDITGIFSKVISDLQQERQVLFSGTPCQVSGLLTALKEMHIDMKNLVCCDLVCHGVPSPKIWKDYLDYIENKYKEPIQKANFRDKSFGWNSHCESFVLQSGKKIVSRDYTDLFYDHIMLRPSCHNCYFANTKRVGDLTLADFWGIEKHNAGFDDDKGVSLVLVNSSKGAELLEKAKGSLEWFECNVEDCMQPTLVKPSVPSARREDFWKDYSNMDFASFLKKYTTPLNNISKIKRELKRLLYMLKIRKHP